MRGCKELGLEGRRRWEVEGDMGDDEWLISSGERSSLMRCLMTCVVGGLLRGRFGILSKVHVSGMIQAEKRTIDISRH